MMPVDGLQCKETKQAMQTHEKPKKNCSTKNDTICA